MKKVWVNRFNSDGGMKPMTEWINIVCNGEDTHAIVSDEYIAPFSGDYPIESFVHSNGLFCEYISNQRGDGWFYVADGDLPPEDDDDLMVMAWDADGAEKVATIKITTLIYHYNRCLKYGRAFTYPCWQPITSPKFL